METLFSMNESSNDDTRIPRRKTIKFSTKDGRPLRGRFQRKAFPLRSRFAKFWLRKRAESPAQENTVVLSNKDSHTRILLPHKPSRIRIRLKDPEYQNAAVLFILSILRDGNTSDFFSGRKLFILEARTNLMELSTERFL